MNKLRAGLNRIKESSQKEAVLIYQMGKVGSTSLGESIQGAINLHTLYANPPCHELLVMERRGLLRIIGWLYDLIRRFLIRRNKVIKIITVIRNPIDRNISMFFQDFPFWYIKHRKSHPEISRFSNDSLVTEIYEKSFPHEYVDQWFDKEIKRFSGIDVYKSTFDRRLGYINLKNSKYSVLVVEASKINDNIETIQKFVGSSFKLVNSNMGDDKWYGPIYKKHKLELLNNEKVNSKIRKGKFFQHFYAGSDGESNV